MLFIRYCNVFCQKLSDLLKQLMYFQETFADDGQQSTDGIYAEIDHSKTRIAGYLLNPVNPDTVYSAVHFDTANHQYEISDSD